MGVRDLGCSPGVRCGSSIHIEEATNLTNVLIHDNHVNYSMAVSGTKNMTVDIIKGVIIANDAYQLTIRNNTITANASDTDSLGCPIGGCRPAALPYEPG